MVDQQGLAWAAASHREGSLEGPPCQQGSHHIRLLRGELLPGVPALPAPLFVALCSGCPMVDRTLHMASASQCSGKASQM